MRSEEIGDGQPASRPAGWLAGREKKLKLEKQLLSVVENSRWGHTGRITVMGPYSKKGG